MNNEHENKATAPQSQANANISVNESSLDPSVDAEVFIEHENLSSVSAARNIRDSRNLLDPASNATSPPLYRIRNGNTNLSRRPSPTRIATRQLSDLQTLAEISFAAGSPLTFRNPLVISNPYSSALVLNNGGSASQSGVNLNDQSACSTYPLLSNPEPPMQLQKRLHSQERQHVTEPPATSAPRTIAPEQNSTHLPPQYQLSQSFANNTSSSRTFQSGHCLQPMPYGVHHTSSGLANLPTLGCRPLWHIQSPSYSQQLGQFGCAPVLRTTRPSVLQYFRNHYNMNRTPGSGIRSSAIYNSKKQDSVDSDRIMPLQLQRLVHPSETANARAISLMTYGEENNVRTSRPDATLHVGEVATTDVVGSPVGVEGQEEQMRVQMRDGLGIVISLLNDLKTRRNGEKLFESFINATNQFRNSGECEASKASELCASIAELLKDNKDLMTRLKHSLPVISRLKGGDCAANVTLPTATNRVSKDRERNEENDSSVHSVFNRIRSILGPRREAAYFDFLKMVRLMSNNVVSEDEFRRLIREMFEEIPGALEVFDKFDWECRS